MSKINPKLLQEIYKKSGLGQARVYARISDIVNETFLPRHLAAIKLASSYGVSVQKFASTAELAQLREHSTGKTAVPVHAEASTAPAIGSKKKRGGQQAKSIGQTKKSSNAVFVVHGRDEAVRKSVFDFLRAVGVKPIEWTQALKATKSGSPYVGDVINKAMALAKAVVVVLTPDDEAHLRPSLRGPHEEPYESHLTGQARPNVLFEAGIAFALHQNRTILLQVGRLRDFSDVGGRHVLKMNNTAQKRQEFIAKLEACGCAVEKSGSDWITTGSFEPSP